ncbi:MAG: TolC family protein [Pigmentiphaga sp.]|uniref:TolC family protein n=1 Tax=Pigmentiphaga sp. TaxID=1977564 RepID=UPI0029B59911|nr:TolC family protein [Pigmentiphaga sp.]MDX3906512.1 TolC family protein [Pigmentiphaga sp.]
MRGSCRTAWYVVGLLAMGTVGAAGEEVPAATAAHGSSRMAAATAAAPGPASARRLEPVLVPSMSMGRLLESAPMAVSVPASTPRQAPVAAPAPAPAATPAPAAAPAPVQTDPPVAAHSATPAEPQVESPEQAAAPAALPVESPVQQVSPPAAKTAVSAAAEEKGAPDRARRPAGAKSLGPMDPAVAASQLIKEGFGTADTVVLASEVGQGGNGYPGAMTLAAIARQAVSWHPNIAAAMGRLNQSGEEIEVAKAGYYPRISTGLRAGRDNTLADSQVRRLSMSATQMLYDFGKVDSSVAAARAAARVNQARVRLAVDQVARDAVQAAIELSRYEELVAAARDQVAGVAEIAKLVKTRHERGASTRSDVMQAQSRVSASESIALQYASQLARWRGVLRTLLGVPALPQLSVEFSPESAAACRVDEPEWSEVPAVLVAEAERDQALALLETARSNRLPTLSVDAGVGRALNGNATRRDDFTLALNMSMDVYQGGALSARSSAAEFALRAADASRDNARLSALQSLTDAREQTSGLTERMAVLDGRRRSISETKDLYRQQYLALGTRSLIDLLNAEQEFHQSRFDQINTKYELMGLGIECLYATGAMRRAYGLEEAARMAGNTYDD